MARERVLEAVLRGPPKPGEVSPEERTKKEEAEEEEPPVLIEVLQKVPREGPAHRGRPEERLRPETPAEEPEEVLEQLPPWVLRGWAGDEQEPLVGRVEGPGELHREGRSRVLEPDVLDLRAPGDPPEDPDPDHRPGRGGPETGAPGQTRRALHLVVRRLLPHPPAQCPVERVEEEVPNPQVSVLQ